MAYDVYFKPSAFLDAARLPLAAWKDIELEITELSEKPFRLEDKHFFKHRHKHYHELKMDPYYMVYKISVLERAIKVLKISRI